MSSAGMLHVRGRVTRHESYGFYVDFGEEADGLVVVTMIDDDQSIDCPAFPAVGSVIDAVLLGYAGERRQARLSIRPRDIAS